MFNDGATCKFDGFVFDLNIVISRFFEFKITSFQFFFVEIANSPFPIRFEISTSSRDLILVGSK